ncbi:MAG: SMP-30/gluconolactonase/LRE family protein [Bryobacteraceae bacterium]
MKSLFAFSVLAFTALMALGASAGSGKAVVSLDPSLDTFIASNAKLEMLREREFGISEGPLWVRDGKSGYLLFSDITANVIYKWTPDRQLSVFMKDAGFVGDLNKVALEGYFARSGPIFVYDFGPNGLTLDPQGRLIICAQGDRAIVRIEKDGKRTVLADRFEGKRLSRPNDVIVKSDGTIYFTDPRPNTPSMELPETMVFMLKDGQVRQIAKGYRANGIALSPDEKILYVNGEKVIHAYDVRPDGSVGEGRVFADMNSDKAPGGTDGMKVDKAGNIYCTGPGGVWIVSAAGKHIGTILLPEPATNLAFGDADYKTLYITDRRHLMSIRLKTAGIAPGPSN